MALALIKLTYRHIIHADSKAGYERNIFDSSYREFKIKAQAYNPDNALTTFSQMKEKDNRANSLHYKISYAALHHLLPLNNKIPVLQDSLGRPLNYEAPIFELIESDLTHIETHKVGIKFITGTYALHQVIGNNLVLSLEDVFKQTDEFAETFTLAMQPNLAITSYRQLSNQPVTAMLNTSFNNN